MQGLKERGRVKAPGTFFFLLLLYRSLAAERSLRIHHLSVRHWRVILWGWGVVDMRALGLRFLSLIIVNFCTARPVWSALVRNTLK